MLPVQLKSGDRSEEIEILEKNGNKIRLKLGNKEYDLDIIKVEKNIYSVLNGNKSYDIEVVPSGNKNTYSTRYICHSFNVEVIDQELRYFKNRNKSSDSNEENIISCPMPGKIIKIPVKQGEDVTAGQVVIVVSAMKMESEYKSGKDGKIKEILVSEGDVIDSNMPLIVLE